MSYTFRLNPFTGRLDEAVDVASVGDVTGPASSTDNALARFDGTTGKVLQNSNATLSDLGLLSLAIALPESSGGTNNTTYAQGDMLYASAANTLSKLAKDTNATRYMSNTGTSNNPAWAQVALSTGVSGQLPLANGGTNANLTASNGGIFYSTATAGAILSGTATARQMLQSGSSTTPAWSTATYPATTTANQLLYSSATNTVSEVTTANSKMLTTNGSGVPSFSIPFAEGTWTPSVDGSTGSPSVTYNYQVGWYTRIGVRVWLTFNVGINTVSGGTGNLLIKGMPYNNTATANYRATGSLITDTVTLGTNIQYMLNCNTSNANILIVSLVSASGPATLAVTSLAAGCQIRGEIEIITDDA